MVLWWYKIDISHEKFIRLWQTYSDILRGPEIIALITWLKHIIYEIKFLYHTQRAKVSIIQ